MEKNRHAWLLAAAIAVMLAPLAPDARSSQGGSPEIQIQRADELYAEGRYDEAREAYRQIADVPGGVGSRAATRLVLSALRSADFLNAYVEAEAVRRARPDDAAVTAVFGDACWAAGRFQEAEQAYDAALKLDPLEARAHQGRARSLAALNRLDEALRSAQEAVRLAPAQPEFHHTSAAIYERMLRFADAAAALREYLDRLSEPERKARGVWVLGEIRFLDAFARRPPLQIEPVRSKDGSAAEQVWRVPIRIRRGKVVVEGRINGASQDFVLDTGAEQTVVSRETARQRGVEALSYVQSAGVGEAGTRGLQIGRIGRLQIGPLKIQNVPCLIKTPAFRGLPTRQTESFSPLALGLSMRLDYEKRELVMARRLPVEAYDQELPMRMHRLAMVSGFVNGSPASFVVDTGGEVISISDATAGRIKPDKPFRRIPVKVFGASGWDRDAFLMPDVNLEFRGIRFDRIPVVVLNLKAPSALLGFQLGGIVGHSFLSRYRVSIDLERSIVGLNAD